MKKLLFFFLFSGAFAASAQYYFKDLVAVQQAKAKQQLYQSQQVKAVSFLSFDGDGKPIEGFSSQQQVSRDFREIVSSTATSLTGATYSKSVYDAGGQLVSSTDTSDGATTTTLYTYADGRLIRVESVSASAGGFTLTETHSWTYTSAGKPQEALRIRNGKDSTRIRFILDEKGLVAEERATQKGKELPAYYYYYDDKGRLTDIVRYNTAARRLLPDYIFEYDEKGRIGSMMVVAEGSGDYQKWYYSYDEDGLKVLDACYSKEKTLIARIEAQYFYY